MISHPICETIKNLAEAVTELEKLEVVVQSEVWEIGAVNEAGNAQVRPAKYVDSGNHNDDFEVPTRFRCIGWSTDLRLDEGWLVDNVERVLEVEAK